jgi:hypothetical protein
MLGLKINFDKSKVFVIGIMDKEKKKVASLLRKSQSAVLSGRSLTGTPRYFKRN